MNMLEWLQNWYLSNCDGDWEHCYGIKIDTLDNPGWSVKIDLIDTSLEHEDFELVQKYIDDNNWIHCNVISGVFNGSGSTDKLEEILIIFKEWAIQKNKYLEDNFNTKSSFEKLEMLEELEQLDYLNNDQFQFLRCLSSDEDFEVRAKVAEILVNFKDVQAEKILISLLKDKDELVRVNACDSLCVFSSDEVIYLLKDRILKDKSSLVKGYATFSLADIIVRLNDEIGKTKNFFKKVLRVQKVKWVKICIYKALYLLGDPDYLDMLIEELDNRYYRNRCIVLSILNELISDSNHAKIYGALSRRLEVETSVAVKSKIEELISS